MAQIATFQARKSLLHNLILSPILGKATSTASYLEALASLLRGCSIHQTKLLLLHAVINKPPPPRNGFDRFSDAGHRSERGGDYQSQDEGASLVDEEAESDFSDATRNKLDLREVIGRTELFLRWTWLQPWTWFRTWRPLLPSWVSEFRLGPLHAARSNWPVLQYLILF